MLNPAACGIRIFAMMTITTASLRCRAGRLVDLGPELPSKSGSGIAPYESGPHNSYAIWRRNSLQLQTDFTQHGGPSVRMPRGDDYSEADEKQERSTTYGRPGRGTGKRF